MESKIRAIITGITGMVGEGVLHECLLDTRVEAILVIGRRPGRIMHPKVREVLVEDFFDLTGIENQLSGYNACYFCLGVSSIGMKEPEYNRLTYSLTLNFAQILIKLSPDLSFCYVSGSGTDISENGRSMWARIKGKTENELFKLPFKQVFAFRPGYMHPTAGLSNTLPYYKYFSWMYPFLRKIFPGRISTLAELGQAMIRITILGYNKKIIEVKDIVMLAKMGD